MERLTQMMNWTLAGNRIQQIAAFFLIVLASLLTGRILRAVLLKRSKVMTEQGKAGVAALQRSVAKGIVFLLFLIGFRMGLSFLSYTDHFRQLIMTVASVLTTCAVGFIIYSLTDVVQVALSRLASRSSSRMNEILVPMVTKTLRITIVVLTLIQIAQVLSDKPITSIIAGLGVGSLAVALAAKDSLQHFFGSLVILADKPFELGERIVVDGYDGNVESIGFRSTRIRLLNGHLVIIPNGDLSMKSITNISRRPFLKRELDIGLTYDTPHDKMERAVQILKELLENHEYMDPKFPPLVFFTDFNDYSLGIKVIYWYGKNDWLGYMAFSHKVNMEILRRFNAEGLQFAFPTQTIHMADK